MARTRSNKPFAGRCRQQEGMRPDLQAQGPPGLLLAGSAGSAGTGPLQRWRERQDPPGRRVGPLSRCGLQSPGDAPNTHAKSASP